MKLRYVTNSPFCRKVAIAARVLKFDQRIEMVNSDDDVGDVVRPSNPLNKIPILITDDGKAIYDSSVIVRYLDALAGGGILVPAPPAEQCRVMTMEALADGIMDALGLISQEERWHAPGQVSAKWVAHQRLKIEKGLDWLNANLPASHADAGSIAVASMLGYLDLRDKQPWRDGRDQLAGWFESFAASVPGFAETAPGRL